MITPISGIIAYPGISDTHPKAEAVFEPAAIATDLEQIRKYPTGNSHVVVDPAEADEVPERPASPGLVLFGEMHGILLEPYPLHRY